MYMYSHSSYNFHYHYCYYYLFCRTSTNQDEAIPEPVQPLEIEPSRINHQQREDAKTITRVASTTLNNNFILIDGQVSVKLVCSCYFPSICFLVNQITLFIIIIQKRI